MSKPQRQKKSEKESPLIMQRQNGVSKAGNIDPDRFRAALLNWYDRHRRSLPWRAGPGIRPDPYSVWLSEIMLQQTVVAAVIPYFQKFVDKWPTVHDLAAAHQNEIMEAWAGLGYYTRARNLHKCARIVSEEYGGIFPQTQEELKKLPGIGDYTSAAMTSIAFDKPATVIDGNVDRVIARYFCITDPLPDSKPEIRQNVLRLSEGRTDRPGDFAQAMMDLGATICTPKSPKCMLCPLSANCQAYREGIQQELPYKRKKDRKPQKFGYVYWIKNRKGQILLERRAETGMLGGMLGLPTSEWTGDINNIRHPNFIDSAKLESQKDLKVHHSFTHFDLTLYGYTTEIQKEFIEDQPRFSWIEEKLIKKTGLPTLFKKFVRLMVQYSDRKLIKGENIM